MEEQVDLGHFLKKAFIVMIALTLVFIGILATLTIIGVIIAIPLLKKGSKMLLQKKEGVEHSHGGKLKIKCPACHTKMKFKDSELLDEK
ncbi:hypothetical protein [Listeria seeligeri]|uniref:Uncharacterized protein n=2 Tax=Listeria seeligeri TaxID=1640 RepID=A0ABR5EAI7_LISSE|nr:hypothetical protein [Listeria seeligeri]EFR99018.1 conserved hypothetical protein [Listeria seeligeri FSL N1-067]KKD49208.1 hypothetical protein UQ68_02500 [Listeria seeligeri]MBC1578503.1 hypothetical protein [Listeria seeligeri]MBC1580554.1 hypothetical protein [Listeria seeligeri]MBC1585595.1 hypothetical protein [Listeria seeligeri]